MDSFLYDSLAQGLSRGKFHDLTGRNPHPQPRERVASRASLVFPHAEGAHARPREYFPSRHTVLQNILESAHFFRGIHDAQPLAAATAFISSCLFMALFFISCFLFRRKLPLVTGRGQGKPSRGSPPGTCRACASSPTTRLPGSTPSGPFARPSRDRRVGYIVVISCAPASSHSLTSTVNLMGLPRISSPGSNGSTVGSSGCSFSGSTLPAPSEKSSV